MVESKVISKTRKNRGKSNVSNVIEKKNSDDLETSVSVFTKTTNPKVIVKSENVDDFKGFRNQNICKRRFLKSICLVVLGIIVLMTFFLSLKTYNIVNDLYLLLSN